MEQTGLGAVARVASHDACFFGIWRLPSGTRHAVRAQLRAGVKVAPGRLALEFGPVSRAEQRTDGRSALEIRIDSSMLPDDEARYAATFLKVIIAVLEHETITYSIHLQLSDATVLHQHGDGLTPTEGENRKASPVPLASGTPSMMS